MGDMLFSFAFLTTWKPLPAPPPNPLLRAGYAGTHLGEPAWHVCCPGLLQLMAKGAQGAV